jgi:hypothetical protein
MLGPKQTPRARREHEDCSLSLIPVVAAETRTAIRDLFGRNRSGDRIGAALALLMTKGRARAEVRTTGGRPSEIWFAKGEA